ncbi:uncharacterized protein LOC114532534 [Dendronephthya gigantea]|uniref:uncharacterized protein LOC114532534 n=1 Tax=Dendronephthya gigantea TaxID=151771 RepID=UPI00106D4D1D|nr:uncharacterized protein LOC114532534 [Dendronephthya gigantea]
MESALDNTENVETLKKNFDEILNKLYSLGLSIHVLKDKSIVFPCNTGELQILDGDEALEHFNRPEYSNKVLTFGSRHFYCHSEYLRLRSEYFEALFAGNFQETTMDLISIELPSPSPDIELLLRYLYTGKAHEKMFYGVEIFKTVENGNYLGVHELVSLAVEAFAVRWKSLVPSALFRRSVMDVNFVRALLKYGSKKGIFQDGDKLKIVVNWSAKTGSDISEARALILENNCLDTASLADLEWLIEANPDLLTGLEFTNFRNVCQRARRENEEVRKCSKAAEEKSKGLLECVRILTKQLEEIRCTKCRMYMPRAAIKTRTCVKMDHSGEYTIHQGWSCCKQFKKKSKGCKPVEVTRHTPGRSSSSSS